MSALDRPTERLLPSIEGMRRQSGGMSFGEAFRVALQGLVANKLRSFLTMLGIIIGVAAVIAVIAMGHGAKQATREAIQRLGTNVLTVVPDSQRSRGVTQGLGSAQSLTFEEVEALKRNGRLIKALAPEYRDRNVTAVYKNQNTSTTVMGSSPEYFAIRNLPIAQGRLFTDEEVERRARVCVIGDEVRRNLFGQNPAVGKRIRLNGQNFEVVGVTQKRGGMQWWNPDDQITMPVTTAMRRIYGAQYLSSISVQAISEERMIETEDEVYSIIRTSQRLRPHERDMIRVFNQADITESAEEQSNFLTKLLAGVAAVSLLVGGIGIMNIMLVSVTERTREIGIRKAIGAKRRDILYQFLIESVTLSVVGGLIGVVLGVSLCLWLARPETEGGVGFPMLLSTPPIVIAFTFSVLVGIFFGIYPASKASRLNPIDALRYE